MHPLISKGMFEEEIGRWPPDLASARHWELIDATFPVLDCVFRKEGRTPLRLRFDVSEWNDVPPSVTLYTVSGEPLTSFSNGNLGTVFNGSQHPSTGRPFVCMAGTKEFHTHPSHLNERWEQYKGQPGFSISDILTKLWHAWLKGSS